ncbi:hypothetical protein RchiOBHm_Chr1g0346611 [Rosa chinensis]|uniref:Uncharacterized protein n=2 Tax=Rosa chinensis TaxID=74649 RepID=A0A2P6SF23_ROSCH|nr:hypothetical protein RchiOBHm_Chr1g0346611 [Rosa chinensis]
MDEPDKWCIYRVPSKLRNVNEAAYTPQLLSIGLFHHGKPELEDMETHKKMYTENFYLRSWKSKDDLKRFIRDRKEKILRCYAGTIKIPIEKDPVEIILVDACFIIELLLLNSITKNHENDYILRSPWLRKAVEQELILFENQLPYSLLEDLYEFAQPVRLHYQSRKGPQAQEQPQEYSTGDQDSPRDSLEIVIHDAKPVHNNFLELASKFFKDHNEGKVITSGVKPKHFTDLVRHFMCSEHKQWKRTTIKNVYNMKKLAAAGVNFEPIKEDARLFIERDKEAASKCKLNFTCFNNMNLKLTELRVKDDTECIVRNVMALEQFVYPKETYVCNYFLLMDQLVDTVEDVDFLVARKVIVNMLGSNEAAANMINGLCDHIMEESSCYVDICEDLNKHYESSWNRHIATLKRVYFKDLWTASSTILGSAVLVFSIIGSIQSFKSF